MDSNLYTLQELDNSAIAKSVSCNIDDLRDHIPTQSRCLNIITQNIRSIYCNLDDLQLNLSQLSFEVDVLILTECWLNQNRPVPPISGYTSHFTQNTLNKSDGVVAYISNSYQAHITELNLTHASGLQITSKEQTILGIYRSPSNLNTDHFITSIDAHLETIGSHKNITILGDININIIAGPNETTNDRKNRLKYLDVLTSHGFQPGHCLPTRGSRCLDHVLIKTDRNRDAFTAVLNTSITDHSMVLLRWPRVLNRNKATSKLTTTIDLESVGKSLAGTDLSRFVTYSDPNLLMSELIDLIQRELLLHTKMTVVPSSKRVLKPWLTSGALRCIRLRNNMQLKLKIDPHNEILKITFKRYRNFCTNLFRKLKNQYNRKKIEESTKNSKHLWSAINDITHYKTPKTPNTSLLDQSEQPLNSLNKINRFFTSIGRTLAEDILSAHSNQQYCTPNINTQLSSFVLLDSDALEVESILMSLDSNSASGWDGIPIKLLKCCKDLLAPILSHLTNLCFNTGEFPQALKRSVVTPVHKGGDTSDVNNYRPISVLTGISKVLEKLLNKRLVSYLTKNEILSNCQYGFRKGLSTQDAVIDLTNHIVKKVDNGYKCIAVFIDLKKAFDTVSVPILVKRLERIGVRGLALNLFESYLTERKQAVKIDNYKSTEENVSFGVPQGSVLGPTLFLVYINELCKLGNIDGRIFCYADDTAIVFSGRTWEAVRNAAESGLSVIKQWLNSSLLTLNISKTNYMCFTPSQRSQPESDLRIAIHECSNTSNHCTCPCIQKVASTKYLGILIDQTLSWHSHIELVISRIRKLKWIFKSLRQVMTSTLLRKIYVALAQSVITYCIPVWGGATKTKLLELERAQRSLIKIMYFKPYRYSTDNLYKLCELLSVRKLYIVNTIKYKHKKVPYDPSQINKRRKGTVIQSPSIRTEFARRQYNSQSAHIYNSINQKLNLYPMISYECTKVVTEWLKTLSYDNTETILKRLI